MSSPHIPAKFKPGSIRQLLPASSALCLLFANHAATGGEVFARCWGASGPYDPAVRSSSGSVTKTLNRDSTGSVWTWRNYAAASLGGVAISARERLNGPPGSSTSHQGVLTTAYWQDQVTIDSPGLTGQFGVVTLTYRVNGSVLFTSTFDQVAQVNRAWLKSSVTLGSTNDFRDYELSAFGVSSGADFMNVDRTVQAEFRFGTPFNIGHHLESDTAIDSRSSLPGRAEVEAAAVWKGFTVTYQDAPLTNFTSSSATVADWSKPMPPPMPPMASAVEGSEMVFTWPAQARCELVASPDLSNWSPHATTPTVSGVMKTVRVPMTEGQRYFRLQSTP